MDTTLSQLLHDKKNQGKEFRILDYNFKVEDCKLKLYQELTNQYFPVYLSHLSELLKNKIEEVLSGGKQEDK